MTDGSGRIGPYALRREIGRGGMGIVYLAEDDRLGRSVALKSLPETMLGDPERLQRFEREARLLASLHHANIAAVYGLEVENGRRYLVLEYVEGETLSDRLERGPLPVREALDLCRQVAAGLEAAHESGVVHRDLKPGNVRITPRGEAKILDFGLAKRAVDGFADPARPDQTVASDSTVLGTILGTGAYMSPEQARGRAVDRRTDIWSFGCLLYECLTGRQAFPGETVSDAIVSVLEREPHWDALPARTPQRVRELLRRCLEKDAKQRLRDMGDARLELEAALADWSSSTNVSAANAARRMRPALPRFLVPLGGIVLGALLGWAIGSLRSASGGRPAVDGDARLSVRLPPGTNLAIEDLGLSGAWDLSPDGMRLAMLLDTPDAPFGSRPRIWLRSLDRFEAEPLAGTEMATSRPVFAADGASVYVQARLSTQTQDAVLLRIPVDRRSPAVTISPVATEWTGFTVLPGGDVLFSTRDGRRFVRVRPGDPAPAAAQRIDCADFDGTFSFIRAGRPLDDRAAFLRTTHYTPDGWHWGVAVLDPETGKATQLLKEGGFPSLATNGHLLYSVSETIYATRFERGSLRVTGQPVAILNGVRTRGRFVPGMFTAAAGGPLVFLQGGRIAERRTLAIAGADGRITPLAIDKMPFAGGLQGSEDGTSIVFTATGPRGVDEVWVFDREPPLARRIASYPDADCSWPAITADGRWVAFRRAGLGTQNGVWRQRTDGTDAPRRLIAERSGADSLWQPVAWAPNGRELVLRLRAGNQVKHIVLQLDAAGAVVAEREILPGLSVWDRIRFAPDGRSITFTLDRQGVQQIHVADWDANFGATALRPAAAPGLMLPRFTRDGRGLVCRDSATIVRVSLDTTAATPLADLGSLLDRIQNLDTLPDGSSAIVLVEPEERRVHHLDVVLDWPRELAKALAP